MFEFVELVIHHGGNFVSSPHSMYVGGAVDIIKVDPDFISFPHLMKSLQSGTYGNISELFFKRPEEPMELLRPLFNDESTLHLIEMASRCGKCEIYAHHGLDEPEILEIPVLPVPGADEGDANVHGDGNDNIEIESDGDGEASEEETEDTIQDDGEDEEHQDRHGHEQNTHNETSEDEDSVEYDSSNPPS
ncbi:unnamed protein product [Cuscuta epithymum]|uniref:PB1-like domain-containing protein n=1 Tax=Cuscuta epithymum TaxID=186058 RepID=A0AAV0FB50_9ASTE|nr:unnamed protein product [Cuscuta epithymum]